MKRILIIFVSIFILSNALFAQDKATVSIISNINDQQKAWNNRDIDAFMTHYWKNDSLLFIGKSGPTYGWQKTLDNYKRSYPDKATMGILSFNILNVQQISRTCYNVIGQWGLVRDKGNIGGYFTLLWKKINSKWVIVQDHTS